MRFARTHLETTEAQNPLWSTVAAFRRPTEGLSSGALAFKNFSRVG